MPTNVQPPIHGVRTLLPTLWFTGDELGEASDMASGAIMFEAPIAFEDLNALDAVIGHLTVARHKIASDRMAAESARRDSTPERSTFPNYCQGEVDTGWGCVLPADHDGECSDIAPSVVDQAVAS